MNRIWLTFALMYEPEAFGRHALAAQGRRSHLRVIRPRIRSGAHHVAPGAKAAPQKIPGGGTVW